MRRRQIGKSVTLNLFGTLNIKFRISSAEVVSGLDVVPDVVLGVVLDVVPDVDEMLAVPFWGREASLAAEVTFSAFIVAIDGADVETILMKD
jgi:hypothetical protein